MFNMSSYLIIVKNDLLDYNKIQYSLLDTEHLDKYKIS